MNEAFEFAKGLGTAGFPTVLVLILYTGYKGVWVWGRQLDEKTRECEQWKTAFLRSVAHADRAIDLVSKTTGAGS